MITFVSRVIGSRLMRMYILFCC